MIQFQIVILDNRNLKKSKIKTLTFEELVLEYGEAKTAELIRMIPHHVEIDKDHEAQIATVKVVS